MRPCPALADLPPPPPGKIGWPWTEAPLPLATRPDGGSWPRISIVTPSYNQGRFIEETIRSVLLQGYPDLEYIVMDAGSTDDSVDIIRKYAPWLAVWKSEPDRGQSHAINKGFSRASGAVLGWLNSDDILTPGALGHVGEALGPLDRHHIFAGYADIRSVDGETTLWRVDTIPQDFLDLCRFLDGRFLAQPSVFFTGAAFEDAGGLREDLHYAMDLDLWLKLAQRSEIVPIRRHLSWMRQHEDTKTCRNLLLVLNEVERILESHRDRIPAAQMRSSRAKLRQRRRDAWSGEGLRAYFLGDRRHAWRALASAFLQSPPVIVHREWIGLLVRLTCPKLVTGRFLHRP
jgi:hypothetical protein